MRHSAVAARGRACKALTTHCCRRLCWQGSLRHALCLCSLALLFACHACVAQEARDSNCAADLNTGSDDARSGVCASGLPAPEAASCEPRVLAVLFAAEANNETQLASSIASTRGFAPACACVASSAAEARARAVLLSASPPHADVTLLRVDADGSTAYHEACLRACKATLPPACIAHSYTLALEADQLLSLAPGLVLPDATHVGVPEAARAGVAAGLLAALSRRAEGYLLWTSVDYVQQAALPLLLRGDAAWSYDAAQRAWKGGAAEDVLHTSTFMLKVEDTARFLENRARFISNVDIFAQRIAANADDGEALYFLAHSLKDAGNFSHALPVSERRVALGLRRNASHAERDHVFLAHLLSGRIYSTRGRLDDAVRCYLGAVEALPSRRTEALTELATMLRLAGQQSRALPFAKAASQASQEHSPPLPGALYVNEAPYDFYADLELSLAAYSAAETDTLVAGVQALTRLLAKPRISRRYWLASYDNAAAFITKLEARGSALNDAARHALMALRAAMKPTPHVCSHEHVQLFGAAVDAADDTACGPDSVLGRLFSGVAVIEMPSRERHVASFLASMGCSRYLRFPAVMHLTPAELSRDHNPRLRNGEIRLVQAHSCVLQYAASLPADARPLAIFEDDVAPLPPATLPAVQHVMARLAAAFDGAGADVVLLGRCPCAAVNATLSADALVQPVQHGFAAVCAHAYAVTPASAAKLHAVLSASASSLPVELDILYLRMQERGELRVFTNAGASVYSQRQLPAALGLAQLKGPSCKAVELLPATDKPSLKLTSFGSWVSNAVTLDEMWLISFVLQNVTGRVVEQIETTRIAEADVIFVAAFAKNRSLVEKLVGKYNAKAVIIFAVGENTHQPRDSAYRDQLVPLADVSLGHRRDVQAPNYMRFPWWTPTALVRRSAATSLDAIGFHPTLLQPANASAWAARPGFALFVNSHDAHPRRKMFELANSIARVDAPGCALNTMAWPRELSNDIVGKSELLSRYRFTLCPENSMSHDRGYVTEKLPQAHLAGAVPLYWGDGVADNEVWNMRRVLVYDNRTSNAALLDTMLRLERDVEFRRIWFEEPVLASGADAWLAAFMPQLADHFRRALAAKGHHVLLPQPSTSGAAHLTYPREFSVCTLSQNEHRYIPEWLEFHMIQGVSHFTIYDHSSQPAYNTVGFEDVLEVIDAGTLFPAECGVRHFEEHAQLRCQIAVFNHCVRRLVNLSKWVGIFDVDEFVFAQQSSSLVEIINARGADAYQFKGVLFGNGWREKPPANEPGLLVPLLTAHYTHRQPCDVPSELRHLFFDHKEVFNPRKLVYAKVHGHDYVAGVVPEQVDTCDATTDAPGILFFHYQHRSAEETVLKSIANNNTLLRLTDQMIELYNSISDERATVFGPQLFSRLASKFQLVPNSGPAPSSPPLPPRPRVHLVSFCGCAFEARCEGFASEARQSGFFDTINVANVDALDSAFRQQHAALLARKFGCGYFIWKAKAALAVLAMKHVHEGEVLAYIDCGCTFNISARAIFEEWVAATVDAPSGLLGLQLMHLPERDWTKADLLHYLGAANVPTVTDSGQLLGGIWFMRVQPSTVALVQQWLDVKTAEAYRFLDDSPSRLPNAPSFREHRHDQSVWSVLRKQAGATMVEDITYRNDSSPIRAIRCKLAEGCAMQTATCCSCDAAGNLNAPRMAFWQYNVDGAPGLTDVVLRQGRVYAVLNVRIAVADGNYSFVGYTMPAVPWHSATWTFHFDGITAPVVGATFGADPHGHTLIIHSDAPAALGHLGAVVTLRHVTIEGVLPDAPPLRFVSVPFCVGGDAVSAPAPQYQLTACTQVLASVAHLLPEWLTYHLLQGFDHFYIYVNDDPELVRPHLQPFLDAGFATLVDWQWAPRHVTPLIGVIPLTSLYQQAQENSCLLRARGISRWVALHDVDEFFAPRVPGATFRSLLSQLGPEPAALRLRTQWFGAHADDAVQARLDATSQLVTSRLIAAGELVREGREKCVVRPEAISYFSVHTVTLGAPMNDVNDNMLRLAHYKYGADARRFKTLDYTVRDAAPELPVHLQRYTTGMTANGHDGLLAYAPSVGLVSGLLRGGLGNQLFVMARAHSLAALTDRIAVLYGANAPDSGHTPAGAYIDTVFARYARTATAPNLVVKEQAEFVATAAPVLPASARHVHLDGYWQHESNIAPGFVSSLQLPTVPPRPHTAFVHVRRGDYVGGALHDVGLVAAGYYAVAMQLLRDKARDPLLRFLVFSDDPDWCRRSGLFTAADVDFFDDGSDTVLSLMNMAACALGGVAANSSFSWWAAFLNSSPLKMIVFPLRWLNVLQGPIDVWLNGSYVVHPDGQAQLIQRPPPAPAPSPLSSLRKP